MLAEHLGAYVAETRFSDLPSRVLKTAKERLLDLFSAGLAGYRLGLYKPILAALIVGTGHSRVWGEGKLVPAGTAATINSFMAHSTYLEDGSRAMGGHPSSAIIPAVLSMAEDLGISGKKVILSIVVGYEIFIRIGAAIYPSMVTRGFQPTAILAALGAAGGCAKLLDLDAEACAQALAIAANLGSGLKAALKESASQPIQVGRSCEGGLLAAILANQGLRGYPLILESFLEAHAETAAKDDILHNLGKTFKIEDTYLKIHGGCRGNHAPVDVILKIVQDHQLAADQIAKIRIGIDTVTEANEIQWPENGKEAQFSIPFSVAAALIYGDASLFQYTDERVKEPAIRAFMEKVQVYISPEMDRLLPKKRGATGEVVTSDGRSCRASIDFSRGEPEMPFTSEEIEAKFNLLARDVLNKRTSQVIKTVYEIEKLEKINQLTRLLIDENVS